MTTYKYKDVKTSVDKDKTTIENNGTAFYTEDKGTTALRLFINWRDQPFNLDNTTMKPVLDLFHSDESIWLDEPLEVVSAESGLVQYKIPNNVIAHAGNVRAKLFLKNVEESVHVANFTFDIRNSGIEGAVEKEISINLVDDAVRRIVKENAIEILGDDFEQRLNTDVINHLDSNPKLFKGDKGDKGDIGARGPQGVQGIKGDKGDTLKYSGLSTSEKEELKSNLTDDALTNFTIKSNSIDNSKLVDFYSSAKILEENDNVLELTREGTYLKMSGKKSLGIPNELETGEKYTLLIIVRGYNANFRSIEIINTSDISKMYKNFVRLGTPIGWKIITEDESILKTVKDYSLNTVNDKLQYNAQVFEKYVDGSIPDLNLLAANAVQDIKIEGLDPEFPLKLWVLSRDYVNGSTAWNYRIIIGQKKGGVWSTVIDTGTNYSVSESDKGATKINYQKGTTKLTARINYGLLPQGGRILDHSAMTEEPYFIIRPKNVSLTDNFVPDVEVYDQSLNTTDNVRFASIKADSIEVSGELKTGTLETPPTGLVKGDMWLDTTDSSIYPMLRVMS